MTRRVYRLVIAIAVALAIGAAAEAAGGWLHDPSAWIPDLAVGVAFVCAGAYAGASPRIRGASALLVLTGMAWFLGTAVESASQLYRGPLVHLLVAFPAWRPGSVLAAGVIMIGWASAITGIPWTSDAGTLAAAALVTATTVWSATRATGLVYRDRLVAASAAAGLLATQVIVALARSAGGPLGEDVGALLYAAALVVIAFALARRLAPPRASTVADLFVEIGDQPSEAVRERLARVLDDPSVEVGYWSERDGAYRSADGRTISSSTPAGRAATFVSRGGSPLAVVIHDAAVLATSELRAAVAAAAALAETNAELRSIVAGQLEEVEASRRRLLVSEDEELGRFADRLRQGPQRTLDQMGDLLSETRPADTATAASLARARARLAETQADLDALARGLRPAGLGAHGLEHTLGRLATGAAMRIMVVAEVDDVPREAEPTVYFVCAEGVTNAVKHSGGSMVRVEVRRVGQRARVEVRDDGGGGASEARGSGLRGVRDRVEALGGTLQIISEHGSGTRLIAEIPLPDGP